jgi:hypothetical protein
LYRYAACSEEELDPLRAALAPVRVGVQSLEVFTPTLEEFAGTLLDRRQWTAARIAEGEVFSDMNFEGGKATEGRWVDEHAVGLYSCRIQLDP